MSGKVNILVECPAKIASVTIGVLNPIERLVEDGYCNIKFCCTKDIKKEDIVWCDIIISVRGSEFMSALILKEAKKAGRYIIYYLDDDLLNLPENALCYESFTQSEGPKFLIECIANSEVLCSGNRMILEKYKDIKPSISTVLVHPPVTLPEQQVFQAKSADKIKLLYAGSVDHSKVVERCLKETVIRLASEMPQKVEFTFIGADPQIKGLKNVKYHNYIEDYDSYKKTVLNGGYHLGLAPVEVSPFHRCKYFNKFIEYTSIGAVGIYTNTEPYTLVIENGKNGFLCENDPESWYTTIRGAIELCLKNGGVLPQLREAGLSIENNFRRIDLAKRLGEEIPELLSFHAPKRQANQINLEFVKIRFYLYRTKAMWKANKVTFIPLFLYKGAKIALKEIAGLIFRRK